VLFAAGLTSLLLGGFGFPLVLTGLAGFAFAFVLPGLLTLPAGVAVWWLARGDLAAMRAGRMDPAGEGWVRVAQYVALLTTAGTVGLWAFGTVLFFCTGV
jgi:hypothetical protein